MKVMPTKMKGERNGDPYCATAQFVPIEKLDRGTRARPLWSESREEKERSHLGDANYENSPPFSA